MENVTKHKVVKLVPTERRRNYLVSELNYHTTKFFTENLLAVKMKETQILMNKPVYLALSILELSKIVMYECWYDYAKPNIDTGSFIVYIKQMIFIKTLQKMLKQGLIIQIMNWIDHYLNEKKK